MPAMMRLAALTKGANKMLDMHGWTQWHCTMGYFVNSILEFYIQGVLIATLGSLTV